jgi:hypothetical protein
MEVNICKNCESYRVDGCCYRTCESWHKAIESVSDYCFCRERCDGCPLHKLGCSAGWCGYRNQALVQVATALQSQEGQEWLSGMKSISDLYRAMGMMTDTEAHNKHVAEAEEKDARITEVAKLLQELGGDACREAAQYLMEYKEQRERDRECF